MQTKVIEAKLTEGVSQECKSKPAETGLDLFWCNIWRYGAKNPAVNELN